MTENDKIAELEARVKELEFSIQEHEHYFAASADEQPQEQASQPDSRSIEENPEEIEPVDVEWQDKKREAEEAVAADEAARQQAKEETSLEMIAANEVVSQALEALRAGEPLQDEPI
jgi:hypothetical protein